MTSDFGTYSIPKYIRINNYYEYSINMCRSIKHSRGIRWDWDWDVQTIFVKICNM